MDTRAIGSDAQASVLSLQRNVESTMLKKAQDLQKLEGQAAMALIEQAAVPQVSKSSLPQQVVRKDKVDVYA